MKNLFRLPSPALVIAILALVIALSGTAIAAKRYLITNTSQVSPAVLKQLAKLAGKQAKRGPAGAAGTAGAAGAAGASGERGAAGPGAVVYWAVVNPDGSLARHGTSATTVEKIIGEQGDVEGTYLVMFDTDVSQCAYEAAIGLAGAENTANPGFATVVASSGEPRGVLVQTYDPSATRVDKGFHLAVFC